MVRRRPINPTPCMALLGGLIGVATPCVAAAAAPEALEPAPPAEAPEAAPPATTDPPAAADVSASSSPESGSPPADGAPPAADGAPAAVVPAPGPVPPAGAEDATEIPEAPAEAELAPAEAVAEPPAEPAVDPSLLEATEPETVVAPVASPRTVEYDMDDPEQVAARLRQQYANRYRNDSLGARLNITGRLQFANMGGPRSSGVGGRMAGGSVDVGAAWNHVSIAGTASAWGGRFYLPEETGAEMNAMFGGGPTLGYGRVALLGHGFFDVRLGYHMYYGVVSARRDGPTVVASQGGDSAVVFTQTENLLPHGPRVRVDMGLLSQSNRKRFHAFGLSMGYQGLVHSARGDLPVTHMLTLGLAYWMG